MSTYNIEKSIVSDRKIAYILSKFPAFTETFIIREIQEIKRRGIVVEIFSLKDPMEGELVHKDVMDLAKHTHYLPYIFSVQIWKSVFSNLFTQPINMIKILMILTMSNLRNPLILLKSIVIFPKAIAIATILRDMGIVKIHAHWATIPTTVAWIVSCLNEADFTFTAHAWDIFKADNMLELKISAASRVITISEFNKHYLETRFPKIDKHKIDVIHIGLDLAKFKPQNRHRESIFTIISVGRMVETKGFHILLRACEIIHKKNIKFRCQIIYVKDKYENQIFKLYEELNLQEIVDLFPNVPQEKITDYYASSDCLVLACLVGKDGDRDGIPTVIIEALAMNLPVVSTFVSGVPEIIKDGVTGLLVQPEDAEGLAEAILKLYNDRDLRLKLGRNGRELVHQEFEISANIDRLVNIIFPNQVS